RVTRKRRSPREGTSSTPPRSSGIVYYFGSFAAALEQAGLKTVREHDAPNRLRYAAEPPDLIGDEAIAVTHALSIFLGKTYSGDRGPAYQLCRVIGALAGIEGPGRNGGWPAGASALRRL